MTYTRERSLPALAQSNAPFTRASASTPLVDFEWSDVKRCRTELWVRRVASLALLAAEVENISTFQAPTEASANQIASCKYVCALRSLGHGCVQEVKNDINTVRFLTQTARFVS